MESAPMAHLATVGAWLLGRWPRKPMRRMRFFGTRSRLDRDPFSCLGQVSPAIRRLPAAGDPPNTAQIDPAMIPQRRMSSQPVWVGSRSVGSWQPQQLNTAVMPDLRLVVVDHLRIHGHHSSGRLFFKPLSSIWEPGPICWNSSASLALLLVGVALLCLG